MWGSNSDDKRKERIDLKKTNVEWQRKLEYKGFEELDRAKETNKNYKAHLGKTNKQIREERDIPDNTETRDFFSEDELNRQNRLESKQIEEIQDSFKFNETKKTLDKVRKNKSSWWE